MRVVEMGKIPEKETKCKHCNSVLAYTSSDVELYGDEYGGDTHFSTSIVCPVCKNRIILTIDGKEFNK